MTALGFSEDRLKSIVGYNGASIPNLILQQLSSGIRADMLCTITARGGSHDNLAISLAAPEFESKVSKTPPFHIANSSTIRLHLNFTTA